MDLVTMVLACSLYPDNSLTNAMLEVGSKNNPLMVTVVDSNQSTTFTSAAKAADYASDQIQQGHNVAVGLMQIPSRWLKPNKPVPAELFLPCKNMVLATKILNNAATQCYQGANVSPSDDVRACMLSVYKTGDIKAGSDYANSIMTYAADHPFSAIQAKAEAANPKGFHMIPGDAATTATTKNASTINPSTDPTKVKKKVADDTAAANDDSAISIPGDTSDTKQ